jgi:hypothetical protein
LLPGVKPASFAILIGPWLIVSATNLYIGVTRAGYSFTEELPVFLLLFGLPAVAAVLLRSTY